MVHVQEVVIDCADPAGLATFWAQVLQSRWGLVNEDWAVVDAKPVLICFQRVPEPKSFILTMNARSPQQRSRQPG